MNGTNPSRPRSRNTETWAHLLCAALFGAAGCQNSDPTASDSAAVAGPDKSTVSTAASVAPAPTSTVAADLDTLIGTFAVQLAGGTTTVQGKIKNGPDANNLVWDKEQKSGDCVLLVPRIPFCETPCPNSEICVEENTCRATSTAIDVGAVTLTGVLHGGATDAVTLKSILKNYQTPAGVTWDFPGVTPGASVALSASGGDVAAFELEALGVSPLVVTSPTPKLAGTTPIDLVWEPEISGIETSVHVVMDISHHGGTRGLIECDTADDGALTIDGDLVKALSDKGTAGFPNILLTRSSVGSARTALGVVRLKVDALLQQDVTIEGQVSCNKDTDCSDGATCATDRVCR